MKIKKAVIPAAGFGTRLLPATKALPKEMYPIIDKPAIQYIVEEAVNSGITDILIISNRGKEILEDHFDENPELESLLKKNNNDRCNAYLNWISLRIYIQDLIFDRHQI